MPKLKPLLIKPGYKANKAYQFLMTFVSLAPRMKVNKIICAQTVLEKLTAKCFNNRLMTIPNCNLRNNEANMLILHAQMNQTCLESFGH